MVEYKQGTIHCTRGDTGTLRFKHKVNGVPYTFQVGDKLVLTVKPKNGFDKEAVAMRITTTVTEPTDVCPIVITKEDSAMAEYQELSVDGVCEQKTTTGKNFLNVPQDFTFTRSYELAVNIPAGTYHLTNSSLSASDGSYDIKLSFNDNKVSKILNNNRDTIITLHSNETKVYIYSKGNYITSNGITATIKKFMLSVDGGVYEKYTGLQSSPSPDYPQEIKTIENSLKITSNNGELEDSENYLFSQIQANLPEGEFIGKINDTYKDTLKVEYNETDGQYHLLLDKKVGRSLNNVVGNIYNSYTNIKYYQIPKPLDYRYYNMNTMDYSLIFTHATTKDSTGIWNSSQNIGKIVSAASSTNFWIGFKVGTTLAQVQELLQNNALYYQLKESYTVDLGIVDMPITYNETTNLFTDSYLLPTINAKYYRNFISTVRNLQVNEKALKQELIDINTRLSALETAQTTVVSESEVVE